MLLSTLFNGVPVLILIPGRDLFEGLFVQPAENVNLYLSQSNYVDSLLKQGGNHKETLDTIMSFLVTEKPLSFEECIVWARNKFEELFSSTIRQLLYNFPKDTITSSGVPFWSGPKRAPDAANFDVENPLHLDFVIAAANLHAFNYGLKGEKDIVTFKKVANSVIVPEFVPKAGVKIAVLESEAAQQRPGDVDASELEKVIVALPPSSSFAGLRMIPSEFEKDDDTNFHIDFVTAGILKSVICSLKSSCN
jgi:ubiquitin-activating enzyme E1